MREPVTFDHLTLFIACAECGSFSGAARALQRPQSVVSHGIAQLEKQLGVTLFDRAGRLPTLTSEGRALLVDARAIVKRVDGFRSHARELSSGIQAELSIAMDALFPTDWLTTAVGAFREAFPATPLRVHVDVKGSVVQRVLDHQCSIAVVGGMADVPESLASQPLLQVPAVTVVSPSHPLAAHAGVIPREVTRQHVQLVLTDRSHVAQGHHDGGVSTTTWRLADLSTKHAFLRAGFGWGHMPRPQVEADIATGNLLPLRIEGFPAHPPSFAMRSAHRNHDAPSTAARWFLWKLRQVQGTQT